MAYRFERTQAGNSIVLDGFENGIADSPFSGIANIKNADITGTPGQASVGFETTALNKPPTVSAVSYTTNTTTDVITVSSTTGWFNGMAITLNTVVTSTGISTGRVYWVGALSGNTFKLYTNPSILGTAVDITGSNGSGTLSSYTFGKPIDYATAYQADPSGTYNYIFILDSNGLAWWINNAGGTVTNNLSYLGNDTTTGTTGRAITVFKGHLIVFRTSEMDGIGIRRIESTTSDLDAAYSSVASGGWAYAWETISSVSQTVRPVLVGEDDIMYYGNSERVGSISEIAGSTLDLDNGATYTESTAALDLPNNEEVASLSELGTNLLVGGLRNRIYPWDRISSSFDITIKVPESNIQFMKTVGNLCFIAAGYRGQIYVTNGSSVSMFKKIPDHLTGFTTPYFTIRSMLVTNNKLFVSFTATRNDGTTAITGVDGVYSIDIDTGVLHNMLTASHNTNGTINLIIKNELSSTPGGTGLYLGWTDASNNFGVDVGSNNPFDGGECFIEHDAIPMGTFRFPTNPTQIEFKLARPLVSGESVEIQRRLNLTGSYTSIGTFNTAGSISGAFDNVNFENCEWLQLKTVLTSTASSPSFVPLKEVRINLS